MKELNKTNRLTIVVVSIVAVILIGLFTIRKPDVSYKISASEALQLLNDSSAYISPSQVVEIMQNKGDSHIIIDVRNRIDFERTHLENTINMPVRELFSQPNLKKLKEIQKSNQSIILIGENQQQAIGPWIMLRQTGFENVKVFTGVYKQLHRPITDSVILRLPQYSELPMIDTAALKKLSSPVTPKALTPQVVKKSVAPIKKEASSGGGC